MEQRRCRWRAAALAALVLAGLTAVPATADAAPAQAVTKRLAVVLVDFTDSRIDASAAYRAKVRDMYFGDGQSSARYFREASDGALTFAPLPGRPEVLGPWTIDMAAACDSGRMNTKTREMLAARGVTGYDSLAIWFPNRLAKCGWGGLGQQPGSVTWMPDGGSASGVAHELGHNLGLRHLSSVTCAAGTLSNCADAGYRGSSVMGGGGYASGLSAPELLHLGWVPPAQLRTAPAPGTYTLVPLHAPASVAGARVLELPRGTGGDRITVAYRKNGNTIDTGVGEGVQLHLTKRGAFHTSQLVDPSPATGGKDDTGLKPGSRVTDGGVTVETVSVTATGATVRVTGQASGGAQRYADAEGRCLDVAGGAATAGTRVLTWACHDGANQRWTPSGDRTLRSLGACLDVRGNATADGTPVILWPCHGQPNQQWTHDGTTLRSATGKCLTTTGGGSATVIRTCDGTAGQRWTRGA